MSQTALICQRCGFATSCRQLGDRCPTDGALLLPGQTLAESRRDPAVGRLMAGRFLIMGAMVRHDPVTVYRGRDLVTDEHVCIKTVAPYAVGAAERIEALTAESRILRQLSHATVPRFVASGRETDGRVWIILEGLRGVSLRALLTERGPLNPNRAINIALRVLAAVDRLHRIGRVHGGLRPENILITPRGLRGNDEIKLLDCGSTSPTGLGHAPRLADDGARYRAPEQLTGHPVEAAADLYTVGALLFEMLVGKPPFAGRTSFEQTRGHCRSPAPPLHLGTDHVALERVVARALEKGPDHRWGDARAMAAALKAAFVDGCGARPIQSSAPPAVRPEAQGATPTRPDGLPGWPAWVARG